MIYTDDPIRNYTLAGIPREFRRKSRAENWIGDGDALDDVEQYIAELEEHMITGHGLFLRGQPGRGKTFLSCEIAKTAVDLGVPVAFLSATQYLSLLKARMDLSTEHRALLDTRVELGLDVGEDPALDDRLLQVTHQRVRRALQYENLINGTVKLLVLDDIGSEYVTGWSSREVETLLRLRPGATVITSNSSNDHLRDLYGDAFVSFLRGITDFIVVGGDDYRDSHATR